MRRDEHDARGVPPVRERNLRRSRRAQRRGDSRESPRSRCPPARSASISSPARPNSSGSPLLRRATIFPSRASCTISSLISACEIPFAPQRFPTFTTCAVGGRTRKSSCEHEIVVQHDVGGLQHAPRLARQQFRVARPRAHEINFSRHFDCISPTSSYAALLMKDQTICVIPSEARNLSVLGSRCE